MLYDNILITNADDLGMTVSVNSSIEEAFRAGGLKDTSLMVNMGCTRHAEAMAKRNPGLSIGIHLNVTEGVPLLPRQDVSKLVNPKGEFMFSVRNVFASLVELRRRSSSKEFRRQLRKEMRYQIESFIETGLVLSHMDCHHFAVQVSPALFEIFVELAVEYGVPAVRAPNHEVSKALGQSGSELANMETQVKLARIVAPDCSFSVAMSGEKDFGMQDYIERLTEKLASVSKDGTSSVELICHPNSLKGSRNRPQRGDSWDRVKEIEFEALVGKEIDSVLQKARFTLVSFKEFLALRSSESANLSSGSNKELGKNS